MESENLWFDLEGERGEEIEKKKKKFEITNSHWREIWRAFGLKRFRSKYYYLTKWTEKSTVCGN